MNALCSCGSSGSTSRHICGSSFLMEMEKKEQRHTADKSPKNEAGLNENLKDVGPTNMINSFDENNSSVSANENSLSTPKINLTPHTPQAGSSSSLNTPFFVKSLQDGESVVTPESSKRNNQNDQVNLKNAHVKTDVLQKLPKKHNAPQTNVKDDDFKRKYRQSFERLSESVNEQILMIMHEVDGLKQTIHAVSFCVNNLIRGYYNLNEKLSTLQPPNDIAENVNDIAENVNDNAQNVNDIAENVNDIAENVNDN